MQTLITCGTPWCELQPLQALLETAGLGKARQANAGSVLGIDQWHDRLCAGQPALAAPLQPGKPWELAAGEIFLANWNQAVWGWADSRSTWLLEFWRDFDPSTRFVLVHTPAYDVLYRAMADAASPNFDSQAMLDTWCAYQTELLRFYHRNRTRSVLLHAHQARHDGTQCVQAINQALGTQLHSAALAPAAAQTVDPLLHLLVQNLLQNHPEVRALEDEIRATLPEGDYVQPTTAVDIAAASGSLRTLYGKTSQYLKLVEAQTLQIEQLERENSNHTTQLLAHQHAQDQASTELRQENELLLLQLHQVQEELEKQYLCAQALKSQLATSQQACDAEVQAKTAAIAQLAAARDAAAQQLHHAKNELSQENELLLLQLHQVQEELEHYFLRHQQATQEKQAVEARLAKILARYPDHTEWGRIEFLSSTVPLRSQIYGLKAGAISASVVDLAVDLVDQAPVLVLTPPANAADQPLHYWPMERQGSAGAGLAPLLLNPTAPTQSESAALLRSLSPGDLQLVRAACAAMVGALPADMPARDSWAEVIGTLRQQLAQLPPAWRYDTVQLKRQQVNPDYEHLWFQLGNVSYGDRHWPTFEFRLGAANVKKGQFSYLPKLEFPLAAQGPQQFENWFEESEDDRGPKFELRFDNKNKAIDIGLWNALSATDQAQALSMCEQLPALLLRVQHQGARISRPWSDWENLVVGLQQAISHSLGIEA